MKVLLSSTGSRGEFQPLLALALELRALGQDARLCVAPNFKAWVESFGLACTAIGADLKQLTARAAPKQTQTFSAQQRRQLATYTVRSQFPVLKEAARGCDLVIAAGALQMATRSVAEALKIPYLFVAYCPAVLPSPDHPPPKLGMHYSQTLPASANRSLWEAEDQSWNELFRIALNKEREKEGFADVDNILRHIFTDRPWLAAEPILAPAGAADDMQIRQTGAWLLPDQNALPVHVEKFLSTGAPPAYFGFGSMRVAEPTSRLLIEAARALGLRCLLSRGWGHLSAIDTQDDCLSIDDLAHEKLFPRVAAIVHHGGAGTTFSAAGAGVGQVIVPHLYDQCYWAHRMESLGVGISAPTREHLTVDAMVSALSKCLDATVAGRARALAGRMQLSGAQVAARLVVG